MRAVIDTSVWVSAIFWTGLPHRLLLRWRSGEFEIVMSPALLSELNRVICSIASRIGAPPDLADEWLDIITLGAELVVPAEAVTACRDPSDNAMLEAAAAGRVDCIVSGDRDLLSLTEFRGIPIVTPAQFLASLESP